ncbi:MAG: ATP-dependent protease LonB [Thermincola sp.]|nr:ATP-dependent protease LonB [Thermincola sp.]MDT3704394.1 ATP-dependent protease LonB [Thermincola sp.]
MNFLSGIGGFLSFVQLFFAIVIGLYFLNLLRAQQGNKVAVERESRKEMDKLLQLRQLSLTEPLSEKTRPTKFEEIIGQEEGLKALRAALCGPNPQHVIIYGSPGVGKTAAARLVLEEAKRNGDSPFGEKAKFVEVDATTARFDERGIADPLIGSVHDPIYQGAGAMGMAGIPQPKSGAVTKAHGGMLFIDEIGELHSIQMNKLLKVLEDRKVFLESAYYSSEDNNIPVHIHDIFQNGLPADFRLVGATTRQPQDIPPAIRSRCLEVFFRPLLPQEISIIAENAAQKVDFKLGEGAVEVVKKYATNGREAVNIIQISAGIALTERRQEIKATDIEWVVNSGQYSPRPEKKIPPYPQVGFVNGLAVYGPNMGTLVEIEAAVLPAAKGKGILTVTGVVDEEEIGSGSKVIKRKSMARGSVENVLTTLRHTVKVDPRNYDIHINFPGGTPIDGPSAGVAIATAVYSAIKKVPVDNKLAMTGEISIRGSIKPIGGVVAKVEAAKHAGAKRVFIPRENYQDIFKEMEGIEVIAVENITDVINNSLIAESSGPDGYFQTNTLSASPL